MGIIAREQWLEQFSAWAEGHDTIRAVILVGSCARTDHPADEWSDIDLILVTKDPSVFLDSAGWFVALGKPLFHIVERTSQGDLLERRVLFEDGLDVDFIVASVDNARQGFPGTFIPPVMQRGWKTLLDKDDLVSSIPVAQVIEERTQVSAVPTMLEFEAVVNDFWFHAVWCAKKLCRGELWKATICCNAYLKHLMLRMIEWHASTSHGPERNTWYDGRFLEQWADPLVLTQLSKAFAHYRTEDVDRALHESMELFHRLAAEIARRWGLPYSESEASKVIALVHGWVVTKTFPV